MEQRLVREIEHGRFLAAHRPGDVWNWESPAGKRRWERRVQLLASSLRPGMRVLELGCGAGYFTAELARTGANVTAIDISPELLQMAKSEHAAANVSYELGNAYALDYPDACFDAIVGSSVLHHLEVDKAVREMYRVLKPAGMISFTEPNMMNPQIALQKNIPWLKRRLGDSPDETAFFRWRLRALLKTAGFRRIDIVPFDFLHPQIPRAFVSAVEKLGRIVERIPIVSEFAGSLKITAEK